MVEHKWVSQWWISPAFFGVISIHENNVFGSGPTLKQNKKSAGEILGYVVISNIFYFHPKKWGRWTHFDEHIFQMGWNHQPVGSFTWNFVFSLVSGPMEFTCIWLKFMACKYISYIMEIMEIIETARLYWMIFQETRHRKSKLTIFWMVFSAKTIVLVRAYNQTLQGTIPFQGCCFFCVLKSFRGKCMVILWVLVAVAGTLLFFGFVCSHRTGTPGKSRVYLVGFLLH